MEELTELIKKKLNIYDGLLKLSVIMNKHEDADYYNRCITKLKRADKILKG